MVATIKVGKIAAAAGTTVNVESGHVLTQPGMVLQVVNAQYDTETSTSSGTYSDTGLTATITPKFATSKVLVQINQNGIYKTADAASNYVSIKVFRDSTELDLMAASVAYTNTAVRNAIGTCSFVKLDNPATTSAVTYKTQFRANGVNGYVQTNNVPSDITLMEIAQ